VDSLLGWLTGLPPAALYLALGAAAAIENVFPPLPSDTVVAFGSFLAARGNGSALGSFMSTWVGNIAGAMFMYYLGRRFGAERLMSRLSQGGDASAAAKVRAWYGKRGVWALAFSRFLPGARALVPPMAGALRVPPLQALLAMALASGVWYALITWFAFHVGDNWDALSARIGGASRVSAIAAAAVVAIVGAVWLVRRRRARRASRA
jgi:membrane protein DedA with SNARE-associated domain